MEEQKTPEPEKKKPEEEEVIANNCGLDSQSSMKAKDLEAICINYAKASNGYPFVGAFMLKSFNEEAKNYKEMSWWAQGLFNSYISTGRGSKEEFVKHFVGSSIVYIFAFERMPTLADDGCYNPIDVFGKGFKSIRFNEQICLNPETFKPFIVVKQRDEQGNVTFGRIVGDPYCNINKEQAEAIAKLLQTPEENK